MRSRSQLNATWPLLSLGSLLLIWAALAALLNSPQLPTPGAVADVLWRESVSGRLPAQLGITLQRLAISFTLAMIFGSAIGVAMGRFRKIDRFLDSWLVVLLNVPALVVIILCYVWFGLTEAAAILAVVLNKLPNVAVVLRQGARDLDRDLVEMARVFRFGRWRLLRHVVWPQLFPFVMIAARTGLALIWKIILVVELLGRSDGMGYQLHLFFQMFDVNGIIAYSIAFVLVVQTFEWVVLQPLDRHANRWRR